jgi:hypothetical protein
MKSLYIVRVLLFTISLNIPACETARLVEAIVVAHLRVASFSTPAMKWRSNYNFGGASVALST